jgi:outer membrane usher protein
VTRNPNIIFFINRNIFHVSLLIVISFLFLSEASDLLSLDSLTQLAATEISMRKLSSDLEESKKLLEQNNKSKTREQLYREIFGISPPKPPRQVEASLTVNEKVDGRIEVIFSEDRTDFSIPAAPVIAMISEMISIELLKVVKSKIDNTGRLTKRQLDELQLETSFDSEEYLVHIAIPPDLLSKQVHDLKGYRDDPYIIECIKPNAISAFMNVYLNEKLRYSQSSSSDSSNAYYTILQNTNKEIRQPVYGNIDGAINIKGVVLEGGCSYLETYNKAIQKKDVRLVYDLPRKYLRFTAGDLSYKTTGYLSYVTIGGLSIAKDYSLQPNVSSYPVSDREFFIKEQSEVDVWVNDVFIRSMVLEPGTHDIRGFPFAAGSNNVRIEIRDFSGRAETLEFSHIYESTLLAEGKTQYACNIGVPSTVIQNEYRYNTRDPYLLATYRRGLTDRLTFDVYTQSFLDRAIAGSVGIYALSLGNFHLNVAGSYAKTDGVDFAARLGFFYRSKVSYQKKRNTESAQLQRVNPITWNTDVEYIGPVFPKRIQDSIEYYDNGIRFSTEFAIPMQEQFNVGLKGSFTIRPDSGNVFGINIGFQKTFFRSLRIGANLSYTSDTKTNQANPSVSVNAQWTFISGPNSFSANETVSRKPPASTDTLNSSTNKNAQWDFSTDVQWDYLSLNSRPEKVVAGITARVGEEYSEYNGRLGYNGNGGSVEFNQNLATPGYFQEQLIQHQSDLSLKTSLVFVDGAIGFSRPVYSGFMIAKGVKNLKGSKIRVNSNDEGYDATSVWCNPAVLLLQSPYQLQKVQISPVNSSVASVNEKMSFNLFPQYKSGFLLKLGTDVTVLVIGTLLDHNRNPLGYQSITVTLKSDTTSEPIRTFTNQAGKFQFMGEAGEAYEIRLEGSTTDENPITVIIPKDNNDFYRVGELFTDRNVQHNTERSDSDSSVTLPAIADSTQQEMLKRTVEPELKSKSDSTTSTDSSTTDTNHSNRPMKWDLSKDDAMNVPVIIDTEDVIKDGFEKNLVDPKARNAYVLGTLRGPEGVLPFTIFEVVQGNDSLQNPIVSFTNRDGKFQIICTDPTSYRISAVMPLKGDTVPGTATFNVPAKSMGIYRQVGTLTLATDQDESLTAPLSKDDFILVTGTLMDMDRQVISYTPISFTSLNETKSTFTGKDGSFQMICRNPGRYIVNIADSKKSTGSFITIPAGTKGHYDIGILKRVPEVNETNGNTEKKF